MASTEGIKEASFYEYVTTPYRYKEKEYPLSNLGEYIRDLPTFPKKSIDKQEIYDHLKDSGAYKYVIKEFERNWESYVGSKEAPREVKKQTWEERRAQYQKEETYLINRYVSQIRNEVDYNDQSFEEKEELEKRRKETGYDLTADRQLIDRVWKEDEILAEQPKGMYNEEWIKKKREIRARRAQEHSEAKTDWAIKSHSPWWIFHHKVDAIWCDCEPEQLRRGIYCKTCKLVLKADKYMMELFKDAAEGRSPSHSLV